MLQILKRYAGAAFDRLPKPVKVFLLVGMLVAYNLLFLAYLLFIGGILPYLIFFHGK